MLGVKCKTAVALNVCLLNLTTLAISVTSLVILGIDQQECIIFRRLNQKVANLNFHSCQRYCLSLKLHITGHRPYSVQVEKVSGGAVTEHI